MGLQRICFDMDDELRWLIALLSDTGMRLAEAVGLLSDDINLDDCNSDIKLQEHPWRSLKTRSSTREVPLGPPCGLQSVLKIKVMTSRSRSTAQKQNAIQIVPAQG